MIRKGLFGSSLLVAFLGPLIIASLQAKPHPESPNNETIILVHGLGRTHRSMRRLERFFTKKGYEVRNDSYPSRLRSVEELSNGWLHEVIQQSYSKTEKIHFVTHSLGGILVRQYLQDHKIPNLGRIVMLSPPNQGCHVTDKLKNWLFYRWWTGPAGQQIGTRDKSLPLQLKPVQAEIGVIAGKRSLNPIFSLMIPGSDDGKVSVECAKLKEMKDFLVLPHSHTFIMNSRQVHHQAETFLRKGQFDRS